MRPLLNYHGGKWRISPWIIENLPEHKIYIEPFGGGLSLLLRKNRSKREIVNDIDSELFNLYRVARDNGDQLKNLLQMTPHSREEYQLSMTDKNDSDIEKARKTIVRCYFGIGDSFLHKHNAFRTTKDEKTCVATSWKNYTESFDFIIKRLSGVTIENLSYEKLFKKYDQQDSLWYLDPPYMRQTRVRKNAYRNDWSEMHHLNFLGEIKKLKGKIVLSGYDSELYNQELSEFNKITKEAQTNGAQKRIECLWIKK